MADDRVFNHDIFDPINERWPRLGDRLFMPGRDSHLVKAPAERSYRMLRGYKRAGDILVQTVLNDRNDCDNLIFPALFNYRHYIELALKAIAEDHGYFAEVSLDSKNHNLPGLWQLFLKISEAFGNDSSDDAVVTIGLHIDEFAKVDGRSTAFRYARNVDGIIPILPSSGLDLLNLHDVMNGIANFFECADLDFTHKSELAAEEAGASNDYRRQTS